MSSFKLPVAALVFVFGLVDSAPAHADDTTTPKESDTSAPSSNRDATPTAAFAPVTPEQRSVTPEPRARVRSSQRLPPPPAEQFTPDTSDAPRAASKNGSSPAGRIALEGLVGFGGEVLLGAAGYKIGDSFCNDRNTEFLSCLGEDLTGMVVGGTIGAISGVYLGGSIGRGEGSFLATAAGGALGVAAGIGAAAAATDGGDGLTTALLLTTPVIGAIAGYELTASPAHPTQREHARAQLRPRIAAAPLKDGGFVSLGGQF